MNGKERFRCRFCREFDGYEATQQQHTYCYVWSAHPLPDQVACRYFTPKVKKNKK